MNSAFNHLNTNDASAIEVTFGELAPTSAGADKAFFSSGCFDAWRRAYLPHDN